jgi:colicin import membrane protein
LSPPPEEPHNGVSKDVQSEAQAESRVAVLLAWARGKINLREPGVAVSAGAHVALLAATLIAFADTKKFDDAAEAIPVEMMSDQQFSQIMKGEKTAKQVQPKQKAEKIAEVTEMKPTPPVAEAKRDVPTPPPPLKRVADPGEDDKPEPKPEPPTPPQRVASLPPTPEPPPRPEPKVAKPEPPKAEKPPEPDDPKDAEVIKPQPVPRPKIAEAPTPPTPPKPVEKPKEPTPPKLDEVAKLLEKKKLEEKAAAAAKEPPKPVAKPKSGEETAEHKFDPSTISQLLSKEAPQVRASTGRELTRTAALGAPNASAARMSPSMWDSLDGLMREQYKKCWSYIGLNAEKYVAQIRVRYAQDGSLQAEPALLNPPAEANSRNLAESAMRAVRRCNPMHIPAAYMPYYEQWKARVVRFDPEDML